MPSVYYDFAVNILDLHSPDVKYMYMCTVLCKCSLIAHFLLSNCTQLLLKIFDDIACEFISSLRNRTGALHCTLQVIVDIML